MLCSSACTLLEGLTRQVKLVKPYLNRTATSLDPIKPLDPVTSIRSERSMMYSSVIIKLHVSGCHRLKISLYDVSLFNEINPCERKDPAYVIELLYEVFHEEVLSPDQ